MDNGFAQFRVEEQVEFEIDTEGNEEDSIFRVFLRSRTGEQIALELSFVKLRKFADVAQKALTTFPGGSRKH